MIWVLFIVSALCVLNIALCFVVVRYRKEWLFEMGLRMDLQEEWRVTDNALLDAQTQVEELLKENRELRSQLPKRDSKGRYCKK